MLSFKFNTRHCCVCVFAACANEHGNDAQCDSWAQTGQCDQNPMWMIAYCRKSCWQCANAGKRVDEGTMRAQLNLNARRSAEYLLVSV